MQIAQYYSHLNGYEYIKNHKPKIWDELEEVIAGVQKKDEEAL